MTPPVLAIVKGAEIGQEFEVTERMLIGRGTDADLVVPDPQASWKHAYVTPADGGLTVEDVGSANGTYVNGQRVTTPSQLNDGDRMQVGTTVFEVRAPVAAPEPAPAAGPPTSVPPARHAATAAGGVAPGPAPTRVRRIPTMPVLMFVTGQRAGSEEPVEDHVVVGRDAGAADLILDQDAEVSRRHATFSRSGAGLTVQDLGSTNGTLVNDRRIDAAVALSNGDRVQIGGTIIEIVIAGEKVVTPPSAPAAVGPAPTNGIEAIALVKEFGRQRAVDGVSLTVEPGQVYGFLGPNGAGKSTTVHMLTTLMPPSRGTARIAGFDIVRQSAQVRMAIGVALQAAALDPKLNAWEHMDLQTALQGVPRSQRKSRAAELIERVGLTDAADRRAEGYSGGMKRRLDLALALVHRPRVLFLDEPTTGLDPQSRTALWEEVARLVKDEGMTVFLTTQYLEEADVLADRVGIIDHGEIVAEDTPANLKAEIGRPTVEVIPANTEDWAAISGVLERFGELVSAAHSGVAVRLGRDVRGLADVIRALDAAGLEFENVELRAPTLDEVFLAKTGRSLEGGKDGAAGGPPAPPEAPPAAVVPGVV